MKHRLSVTVLAIGLLLSLAVVRPQGASDGVPVAGGLASQASGACGASGPSVLRGTWAFTATAWQDLSQINPALPTGYAPVTIIGTFKVNGKGDVTGQAWINAGGLAMTAEFVNSRFGAPKPDCTFPLTLSMKIEQFGEATVGPYPYVGVIAGDGAALEIAFMMLGAGPGSHVELDRARRISMNDN
jgi:hypothetical protein